MSASFSEVLSRQPLRAFSIVTFLICMFVLVADGLDQQLLGLMAPLIIDDFGTDRGTFGIAVSASLVGFGLGSWSGGWLGDSVGRRWSLALSAAVFSIGTIAASTSDGVWMMAFWRVVGGLGFGGAYSNAITMAGEWVPERWRSVAATTISVGTPAGSSIAGLLAPSVIAEYGWRGAFVFFGVATLILCMVLIVAFLRDSPTFLLTRGKKDEAQKALRKITDEQIDLVPDRHAGDTATGSVGVFHRSNLRMNIGVCITFMSVIMVAYGVLNWTTTMLTARGFAFEQASYAIFVAGLTSIFASIAVGFLIQRFGSKLMVLLISITLLLALLALGWKVETLSDVPTASEQNVVIALVGLAAAIFSAGVAANYAIMTRGYPSSCRSAGIGFGIFMARIGAITSSALGGKLLDLGGESAIPFFTVLCIGAILTSAAAFIIDEEKHVPPSTAKAA
ncbi:MAG: MFS transporter [Gammaproteobacteria bacterium]|nr:MFS transporter [Gammaproteobacteria bacterium]